MHALSDISSATLESFKALVMNKSDRWISGVKGNKIAQVRLMYNYSRITMVKIVVKERSALPWMKVCGTPNAWGLIDPPEGFSESLGLVAVPNEWKIGFGIDYS